MRYIVDVGTVDDRVVVVRYIVDVGIVDDRVVVVRSVVEVGIDKSRIVEVGWTMVDVDVGIKLVGVDIDWTVVKEEVTLLNGEYSCEVGV